MSKMKEESRLSRIVSRTDTEILDDGRGEKRHTIYYMNIEVGRNKYYLHKRYTEFLMLHQKLCEQQYPEIEDFDFPAKVWFNNFSDAVIEYRRTRFEAYLTLLLELVNKYPPLRKDVEAFLGVPQVIDPPKKYPKTPIPGRKPVDKPFALMDDSTSGDSTFISGPTTTRRVVGGGGSEKEGGAFSSSKSFLPARGGGVTAAGLASPIRSPVRPHPSSSSPSSSPLININAVIGFLGFYVIVVVVLAFAALADPSKAKICATSILLLSATASVGIYKASKYTHQQASLGKLA